MSQVFSASRANIRKNIFPVTQSTEPKIRPSSPWLVGPVVDLFFCCGVGVWVLTAFHFFALNQKDQRALEWLSFLSVFLTHLLSNPHTAATWVRLYGSPGERSRFHWHAYPLSAAMILVAVIALRYPEGPAALGYVYLLWVVQHYASQTYGLGLLYCAKRGFSMSSWERKLFQGVLLSTAVFAIFRKLTFVGYSPTFFLGLKMPFWGPLNPEFVVVASVLWAVFLSGWVVWVCDRGFRWGEWFPYPSLILVFSVMFFFLGEGPLLSSAWIYVPPLFHGSQYLLISGVYQMSHVRSLGHETHLRDWFLYWALLMLIGTFIYISVPRILTELGVSSVSAMAVVFSVVNFHHFLTDRAIWKLRDPETRQLLMA